MILIFLIWSERNWKRSATEPDGSVLGYDDAHASVWPREPVPHSGSEPDKPGARDFDSTAEQTLGRSQETTQGLLFLVLYSSHLFV